MSSSLRIMLFVFSAVIIPAEMTVGWANNLIRGVVTQRVALVGDVVADQLAIAPPSNDLVWQSIGVIIAVCVLIGMFRILIRTIRRKSLKLQFFVTALSVMAGLVLLISLASDISWEIQGGYSYQLVVVGAFWISQLVADVSGA